jgi:hypothetical protein
MIAKLAGVLATVAGAVIVLVVILAAVGWLQDLIGKVIALYWPPGRISVQ